MTGESSKKQAKPSKKIDNRFIKFTQEMVERVNKVQKPVLQDEEQYQRVQFGGAMTILRDYRNRVVENLVKIGAFSDEHIEALDDEGTVKITDDLVEKFNKVMGPVDEVVRDMIINGMQVCATNYAGLVLEGKMDPIYDRSLEDDKGRSEVQDAVLQICERVNVDLAERGMLEETKDGRLRIKKDSKMYEQVGDIKHE